MKKVKSEENQLSLEKWHDHEINIEDLVILKAFNSIRI